MKFKFLLSFILLFLFFVASTTKTFAATCGAQDGHCIFTGTCAVGGPISASDCTFFGFKCCPNDPGNPNQGGAIITCSGGGKGVNTALGCISYDATQGGFISSLLGLAIGLGGGIALLLILYGIFIVTTSAGIPDKLKSGNEIITSAVSGLLFIILAIFLMNLVGIKILALPGLQ